MIIQKWWILVQAKAVARFKPKAQQHYVEDFN